MVWEVLRPKSIAVQKRQRQRRARGADQRRLGADQRGALRLAGRDRAAELVHERRRLDLLARLGQPRSCSAYVSFCIHWTVNEIIDGCK